MPAHMFDAFFMGAVMMGCCVISAYFFKFWRETNDRLFLYFAISFLLMAINRLAMFSEVFDHMRIVPYGIRFISFAVILLAIIDKNLVSQRRERSSGS